MNPNKELEPYSRGDVKTSFAITNLYFGLVEEEKESALINKFER